MSDNNSVSESQLYSPKKNQKKAEYGTKKRIYNKQKSKNDKKVVGSGVGFQKIFMEARLDYRIYAIFD